MIEMLRQRLIELENEVRTRQHHKNPMYYATLNNLRWCRIALAYAEGKEPNTNDINAVCGIKQVRTINSDSSICLIDFSKELYEGANIMDILNKYRDVVPNIHDVLEKALKDAGYRINGFYVVKD